MEQAAVRSGAYLHHILMTSPNPGRLASFYADAIDMTATREGDIWICRGPARTMLFSDGPAKGFGYGAFACRDLAGLDEIKAQAQQNGVTIEPSRSSLFGSEAFGVTDPDGRHIVFGLAPPPPAKRGPAIRGPLQHLTLATLNVEAIQEFYANRLGFAESDRVLDSRGTLMTCFMRSNHEHHTLACFRSDRVGVDHHSYEAGEWDTIRDWCDHLAERHIELMWGPGRHGPGNNLFIFIKDPDENWIEISAELEVVHDRAVKEWPHEGRTLNRWGKAILRAQDGV